jgi:hypothetical protein
MRLLTDDLTDKEIIYHLITQYGDPRNYEAYDAEYGDDIEGARAIRQAPWVQRDKGEYALKALNMLVARKWFEEEK